MVVITKQKPRLIFVNIETRSKEYLFLSRIMEAGAGVRLALFLLSQSGYRLERNKVRLPPQLLFMLLKLCKGCLKICHSQSLLFPFLPTAPVEIPCYGYFETIQIQDTA